MLSVCVDSETHLVQRGLLAPPVVCGTWCSVPDWTQAEIALRDPYLDALEELLQAAACGEVELVGANIGYDFGCAANERPRLLPLIFKAYDAGAVFDILIAEALIDLARGMMFKDPVSFKPFRRYKQALLEERHLDVHRSGKVSTSGRGGASAEEYAKGIGTDDDWRLRYALLDGVPLEQWPQSAVDYPKQDVGYALAIREIQRGIGTNLHNMGEQARAAWALHLSAMWGVRTDPQLVAEVIAEVEKGHHEALARFAAIGFIVPETGKKNTAAIKRAVAVAYGANPSKPCANCGGTGKVPSPKSGNPIQCKGCDATGYDLADASIPPTDGGGISTSEDTLTESGDEQLEAYAETGNNEKMWTTYRPILLQGVALPINPEINALLETGRCSYREPNLQNQPRKGKVRECYVPRPGHLFCSVDYGTLELVTLAQVCLWWTGHSAMADAINAGRDLHDQFAARVRALSYEQQHAERKAGGKGPKDMRQLAKAPNFGLPGGLGAAKLVVYARQAYDARFCELSGRADKGTCGAEKVTDPRSGKRLCAVCLSVARELRELWFQEWPEVGEYHQIVSSLTEGELGGAIQVPGPEGEGRPGPGLIRGGCHFCDGSNNGFQGLAARAAKAALYRVTREAYTDPRSPLWGTRVAVFIHDELLCEVPEEKADLAAHRISAVMIDTLRDYCPDVAGTAPPALMRRWFKGAEPVYQCPTHGRTEEHRCCEAGQLVPWEPKAKKPTAPTS